MVGGGGGGELVARYGPLMVGRMMVIVSSIDMKANLLQKAIGEAIEFTNGIEPKKRKTSKGKEKNKVESAGIFSQTFLLIPGR